MDSLAKASSGVNEFNLPKKLIAFQLGTSFAGIIDVKLSGTFFLILSTLKF